MNYFTFIQYFNKKLIEKYSYVNDPITNYFKKKMKEILYNPYVYKLYSEENEDGNGNKKNYGSESNLFILESNLSRLDKQEKICGNLNRL